MTQDRSGSVQYFFELLEAHTRTGMGNHALNEWNGTTSVQDNDSDAAQARKVLLWGQDRCSTFQRSDWYPIAEGSELARRWQMNICPAELERLTAPVATALQQAVETKLKHLALQPLEHSISGAGRVVTVQTDGVIVLERALSGVCAGIEIKSVLIAPENAPSERTSCNTRYRMMLARIYQPSQLLELVSGLLRVAGVRVEDRLVGVSDGAVWIDHLLAMLGVEQVIDVYHGLEYAVVLMNALGWSEVEQATERRLWCKGQVNVGTWLATFGPVIRALPVLSDEVLQALKYLEARASRMAYKDLRAQGLPIGSGQIEGMNKLVIGGRLKQCGMRWSRDGASRMGLLRSQTRSRRAVVIPGDVRFAAFPIPHH